MEIEIQGQLSENTIARASERTTDVKGVKQHTDSWRACSYILVTQCFEELAYYGIQFNLVTFLKTVLNESNVTAARNYTNWQGACYIAPLVGAIIADSYLGRYLTTVAFFTVYLLGMSGMSIAASFLKGGPSQSVVFFLGLYLMAIGAGGIKPCVSSFGADQFDDSSPDERLKKDSFFNWFFFAVYIGSFLAGTAVVWVQDHYGWAVGLWLPTLFIALAIASFLMGSNKYRVQKPLGSPIVRVLKVIVAAFRKWNAVLPHDDSLLYELPEETPMADFHKLQHTPVLRFLDKAAVISSTEELSDSNPWRLCTVTQVEELKVVIGMLPVWASGIVFFAVLAQFSSTFLEQGRTMNKHVGAFAIPPASLASFYAVSVLIWVPVYDRVLVPVARRLTGNARGISELQRFGAGLLLSVLVMTAAALVETRRLASSAHGEGQSSMSILWQIPQYFLVGASVVFACVGQTEFFYNEAPPSMRSLCSALALLTVALGSYVSSLVVTAVAWLTTRGGRPGWIPDDLDDGHLDRFFWLLAAMSALNLAVFVCCARCYKSKRKSDAGLITGDGSVDIKGHPAPKHTTGNWRACFPILGNEFCERLAYYGIARNLVTYLKVKLHVSNLEAARHVTAWQGTCYLTPLIGAILADSHWGKYWTIAVFSSIYFISLAILTLSASVPALQPPTCLGTVCPKASLLQYGAFFVGLYMLALGTGGIKPCVSSFGADQFDDTDPAERAKKTSFFNWFYFCISMGSFISGTIIVWIQDNSGWGIGFAIPTISMALAIASFFAASNMYRFQKPGGSPLTRVCQVVVAAFFKRHVELPNDTSLLYEVDGQTSAIKGSRKLEHTNELKFLDRAAIVSFADVQSESSKDPWKLCTVTQVEELKILLRMFPIWATTIIFSAVYAQNSSLFVEQGMVLDKRIGSFTVPPASLSTLDVISVIIWIPLYDRILVPIARKFTGREKGFSELQRIGIGLILSILAMVSAALVELKRLEIARSEGLIHEKVDVPMSILWQIPQYFLVGAAEVFTVIGQVDFFYDQGPDAMRSLCSAFALVTVSVGDYVSSIILTVVSHTTTQGGDPGWIPDNLNEGHLDRFFWLIAGISFVNFVVFVGCASRYRYKKAQ